MDYMEYKGYKGSVEYSKKDDCLFGKVQGLGKALILYEGNTLEELRRDFEDGVDDYLAGCKADGVEPCKPYSGRLNLRMTSELHSRIAAFAASTGTTINDFINRAVQNELAHALVVLAVVAMTTACTRHYEVVSMERTRIVVDSRYDAQPDAAAAEFLKPYKHVVDSVMGPVVGRSAKYMTADRPEGTLSNLLADIMVWAAKDYGETVDFGVYNMGGVRAALPKGDITYGDVLDIAPFENKIAFTTLSGADVLELFGQMAAVGGEGVSHAVRIVMTKDGRLVSATINGEPVDPQRDYRVTTIDYLLGGTDKMGAFKKGRNVNSPQEVSNNSRFVIMNYFREQTKQGRVVDAEIEGRVTVEE